MYNNTIPFLNAKKVQLTVTNAVQNAYYYHPLKQYVGRKEERYKAMCELLDSYHASGNMTLSNLKSAKGKIKTQLKL